MDKRFETYVNQIVNKLACSREEKEEIKEEMTDHLLLLKQEHIDKGYSEVKAIELAIQMFGEQKEISKGLEKSIFPYKKVMTSLTILLGLIITIYVGSVTMNPPYTTGDIASFLFYLLPIFSIGTLGFALFRKSWILMLLSGLILLPVAFFLSLYPRFPWAIFIPLFHVVLSIVIFQMNKTKKKLLNSN